MKLVNSKTLAVALAVGLTFTLASCAPADEPVTPSPTATLGEETITGNSDEVTDDSSSLIQSDSAPKWAADVFAQIPAGWFYMTNADEKQSIAIYPGYDVAALQAFTEAKLTEGWAYDLEPVVDDVSYVATLYRGSEGEYLNIVGVSAEAPGAEETGAASSVIFTR